MGPLGANINKYQCPPMQSSDEHFLNYFFSFFFYKKSNDIFFSNFYKVWVGRGGREGSFPPGSRSPFRGDRYGADSFSSPGPGHPHARVTVASPRFPPLPGLLPSPPAPFFPELALATPLTDSPAPRPWSVSVRRGRRGSSRVRWPRAPARARRGWGAGSWSRGGSGC